MAEGLFTADLFTFLEDLRKHNDRTWFAKNKERYLDVVQEPALEFVRSFGPYLRKISPHFVADDRPSGGSLFRIYRDIRRAAYGKPFQSRFHLSGDSLKRAPAGFAPDHPLIGDLKRKDHVCDAMLDERTVTSKDFLPTYAELCKRSGPYISFLCEALDVPF
jgi:uncharacterized protein (DUF2461 family)